jgi:5-methylcytosine-specific restriction endonuclease McrA
MKQRKQNNPEIQRRISKQRYLKYHSDPVFRQRVKEINNKYSAKPEARKRNYVRAKAWAKTEKGKAWRKAWEKESEAGKRTRKTVMKNWLATPSGKEYKARHCAKRRGLIQSIPSGITAQAWNELLGLYDYRCAYCGNKFSEINPATRDHIVPITRGGTHVISNLRPACRKCNSKKNNRTLAPLLRVEKATA